MYTGMKKSIAIETVVFIILAVVVLIVGIIIVFGLYNLGKYNIQELNKTYNKTYESVNK